MNLFTKLRDFLSGRPAMRNRKGGLAFVSTGEAFGFEAIEGHVVTTVCVRADGFWQIDPPQLVTVTAVVRMPSGAVHGPGTVIEIDGIADDALIPIRAPGVSKEEVAELYLTGPVRRKETA